MSQEQQKNTYADSNSMAAGDTQMKMMSSIVPGSKKTKTISIYNPFTEKMSRVAPYSAKAKKIYRYYIKELSRRASRLTQRLSVSTRAKACDTGHALTVCSCDAAGTTDWQ